MATIHQMIPVVFSLITEPPLGNGYVFDGLEVAIRAAQRFSGNPVYLLTDVRVKWMAEQFQINVRQLPDPDQFMVAYRKVAARTMGGTDLQRLDVSSTLRWHYLLQAIRKNLLPFRVFPVDWDVLIFSNIEFACEPFADYDLLCANMHPGRVSQCPCGMFSVAALSEMVGLAAEAVNTTRATPLDMGCWTEVYNTGRYKVADVGKEHVPSHTVFDGNLGDLEDSEFMDDGNGYKLIEWKNGLPHLVAKHGGLVRAHTLHCWGNYKNKMRELMEKTR